jgi:AcrR family transcriptional regulator
MPRSLPTPRSLLSRALLLASLLLGVACVRQGGPDRPVAVGGGAVVIVFSQAPEELPFNPRGARLLAATQQLEAIVAHPVAIQLDAALLPQWAQNFENGLASGIENVARDFDAMKHVSPRVFAYAVASLRRSASRARMPLSPG